MRSRHGYMRTRIPERRPVAAPPATPPPPAAGPAPALPAWTPPPAGHAFAAAQVVPDVSALEVVAEAEPSQVDETGDGGDQIATAAAGRTITPVAAGRVQRSPAPPGDGADDGGASPAGGQSDGKTTVQDPASKTVEVHGAKLAEVAATLPDEPGSVEFDFTVSTTDDPTRRADLRVTQTLTMPKWVERDRQPANRQRAWDAFVRALETHEQGHVAINRREFANAHRRFIGKTADETPRLSDELRREVTNVQNAVDLQTDHGRRGNPPTILDTSPDVSGKPGTSPADASLAPDDEPASEDSGNASREDVIEPGASAQA